MEEQPQTRQFSCTSVLQKFRSKIGKKNVDFKKSAPKLVSLLSQKSSILKVPQQNAPSKMSKRKVPRDISKDKNQITAPIFSPPSVFTPLSNHKKVFI